MVLFVGSHLHHIKYFVSTINYFAGALKIKKYQDMNAGSRYFVTHMSVFYTRINILIQINWILKYLEFEMVLIWDHILM